MLHNLLRVAEGEKDKDAMLRYLNAIVTVNPEAAVERGLRAGLRYQTGDRAGALQDVDWLLEHEPEGLDVKRVREFRRLLTQPEK
jgi:regulator of sirC expression with transglutaminase-like and TPR domain